MGRSRPGRGAIAIALAAAAALLPATGARASDEVVLLEGTTQASLTIDLDGDGAREVVRIVSLDGGPPEVEVWSHDGTWQLVDAVSLGLSEPTTDGLALVPLRVDGRARVLAVVAGYHPETGMQTCCERAIEIHLHPDGIGLSSPTGLSGIPADTLYPLDMDADRTDELFLSGGLWSETENAGRYRVLRRDDGGWRAIGTWRGSPNHGGVVGDTDGVPGDEILLPLPSGRIERTAWAGGLRTDRLSIARSEDGSWLTGTVGDRLIVGSPDGVRLVRAPFDGPRSEQLYRAPGGWAWLVPIGSGPTLRFVVAISTRGGGEDRVLVVLDEDLRELGREQPQGTAVEVYDMLDRLFEGGGGVPRSLHPYVGPMPMGGAGVAPAYSIGGGIIEATTDGYDVRPSAAFATTPIGFAGPDDGWVVMGDSFIGWERAYHLGLSGWGDGQLALVPSSVVEDPVGDPSAVQVSFDGAVTLPDGAVDAGAHSVLAHSDGFTILVDAPYGSAVVSGTRTHADDHGRADTTIRIPVRAPRNADEEGGAFEHWILVVGPDGRTTPITVSGSYVPAQPAVSAEAAGQAFELAATVSGTISAGSTVEVDGRAVAAAEDGTFRAEVEAPLWPRDVVVTARDPFGAEQTTVVQVVGWVDYRGWPWAAMLGVLTLVAGAVLFLRIPRQRRREEPVEDGWDGRLEEVDGDLV